MKSERRDDNAPGRAFALDLAANPHPDLLLDALRTRARSIHRPWDRESAAEWAGYLRAMAKATGCTGDEIEQWMDRKANERLALLREPLN